MNKFFKAGIVFVVAIVIISILKPFVDEYEERKKYEFNVKTLKGELTNSSFKGKAYAIYFGYMYCPDVCPTSLGSLASALNSFEKEKIKNFSGLFISVDPNRDTLENLNEYSKYFHDNFIGGTTDEKNIDDIVSRFGSYYKKVNLENSAMDYSVAHTSYIYLFDKNGRFVKRIDHSANPDEIYKSLKKVL